MAEIDPQYVEEMPADFDRFVGGFFPRKAWTCRVKYDHRETRLFLEVTLADSRLSADDRFLTLLAFYARSQRLFLRQNAGIELQCRAAQRAGNRPLGRRARRREPPRRRDDGPRSRPSSRLARVPAQVRALLPAAHAALGGGHRRAHLRRRVLAHAEHHPLPRRDPDPGRAQRLHRAPLRLKAPRSSRRPPSVPCRDRRGRAEHSPMVVSPFAA